MRACPGSASGAVVSTPSLSPSWTPGSTSDAPSKVFDGLGTKVLTSGFDR